MAMKPRMKERYNEEIVPALMKEFAYANVMQVPRMEKVTVNVGLGEAVANAKALDAASLDIATITGQHPVITRAKKSISNFKLREGMPIGVTVTLRGSRLCGRPRAFIRKFALCRICFRQAALEGHLPGVQKASW